jgi:hypothetical protein
VDKAWYTFDTVPVTGETLGGITTYASNPASFLLNSLVTPVGNLTIKCYINDTNGYSNWTSTYTYVYVPLTFQTFSINETYTLLGHPLQATVTVTSNPFTDKAYLLYGIPTPNVVGNVTPAGVSTNMRWPTTGLNDLTYSTRGCVNDTLGGTFCSVGTINVRFYTTTTTLATPPWSGTTLPNTPQGSINMRPCFANIGGSSFNFLKGILCPYETAFGGN